MESDILTDKKFTLRDLKKELDKIDSKYDEFELRELHLVSKNYNTGEKIEAYGGGGWEDKERVGLNPVFVHQTLVNKMPFVTRQDIIFAINKSIEDLDVENPKIGSFDFEITDENGVIVRKLVSHSICDNDVVSVFDVIDEYR